MSVPGSAATLSLGAVSRARDPLTSTGRPRRLVTCSCGWGRECVSEWAAQSVSRLHQQLGEMGVEHATKVEGPDGPSGGEQLTLA